MGAVREERCCSKDAACLLYYAMSRSDSFYMPISYGSIMHYELAHDLLVRSSDHDGTSLERLRMNYDRLGVVKRNSQKDHRLTMAQDDMTGKSRNAVKTERCCAAEAARRALTAK